MSVHRTRTQWSVINLISLLGIVSLLVSCQNSGLPVFDTDPAGGSQDQIPDYPKAEVTFEAQIPSKLQEGENLYLEILDEVTGLALNAARVQMETQDQQTYVVKLPLVVGSVMKYRYTRDKEPVGIEYTSRNQQVRYRLYSVNGPGSVRDTISAWKSSPASGKYGRIFGQVAFSGSNAPVVNALVVAGGIHTLTASDGSFIVEGLPSGVHHVVVYSLDGSFQTFQQGAVIAVDSTTPAFIQVEPSRMVNVTFLVQPPQDSLKGIPIRLVGNTLALGNTFADLKGGISVIASRAPMMELLEDGRYKLTIKLPAGSDLRYKYSLGDGYWNAERTSEGGTRLRQLIVPNRDITVEDAIDTWKRGNSVPVTLNLTVPGDTPVSDSLSIQLNPFGWTEAVPMWPAGDNHWFYILYEPSNALSGAFYRYCRNEQCGTADAVGTAGPETEGIPFPSIDDETKIDDRITNWSWMDGESEPIVVPADEIRSRGENFQAGVALQEGYHPNWQPYIGSAFKNINDIGANAVILSPTWHLTHQTPPVIELIPGSDPLWFDLIQMIGLAQKNDLEVTIHPVLEYAENPDSWWLDAARDESWWQSWFDRYQTFVLYHADLAAQTGAKALILGDESIIPALPDGKLVDGSPSGVPGNATERWERLIKEVRTHYTGKLLWFIPYKGELPPVPTFISAVDQLYVQISPPISSSDQVNTAELEESLAVRLDGELLTLQERTNQPVLIGLHFPSVSGALDGCVEASDGCLLPDAFRQPAYAYLGVQPSFKEQANVYNALLSVVNQRSWISGFYAAGYYPPVSLKDMSASVRGKPASDVLWYWYPRLLGQGMP